MLDPSYNRWIGIISGDAVVTCTGLRAAKVRIAAALRQVMPAEIRKGRNPDPPIRFRPLPPALTAYALLIHSGSIASGLDAVWLGIAG
jgi:hypothetical protein